ncbi:MAG: hypothetical protein N3E46_07695, partial [Gemmataceae bacterium]|nr:hypothetical protein [Gemmataceae bacterium]
MKGRLSAWGIGTLFIISAATLWAVWSEGRTVPADSNQSGSPPELRAEANLQAAEKLGWFPGSPRPEIRPHFTVEHQADGTLILTIQQDNQPGLGGYWEKRFPVTGGQWYQFQMAYRAQGVAVERRCVLATVHWRNSRGQKARSDEPTVRHFLRGFTVMAETEFPETQPKRADGWSVVEGQYRA